MFEDKSRRIASVAGLLLFGSQPKKYMPQSGISAVSYTGKEKDYEARARQTLRGPLVSLFGPDDGVGSPYPKLPRTFSESDAARETGVIEQALDFVRRNTAVVAAIDSGGQRQERWDYPLDTVREAVVNALVHRDYLLSSTDIELTIYDDRMEIVSPGRLPNGITPARMLSGCRAARNQLIKDVMRDYRYLENSGMGVPRKIVKCMREHNGTEPVLIEDGERFILRLLR